MKFETKAIHGGQQHEPTTGAVMTPIFQTSTYAQKNIDERGQYAYSRVTNPTRTAFENGIASLENGTKGFAFASGLAAIDAVLRLLNTGDEVIAGDDLYGGSYRMFTKLFEKYGLKFKYVDMNTVENVTNAISQNTKLIWIETPTNPLMKICDIEAITKAIKSINYNILIAVDNTFATPYIQTPLDLGSDIVMHSATKHLGGHSDIIMGALVVKNEQLAKDIHFVQYAAGAIAGPMDCFLALRGLKTLHLRMQRHCENCLAVANYLKDHPKVSEVFYPGFEDHENYGIAKKQMKAFGAVVSFKLKDESDEAVKRFFDKLQLFTLAESLGGVESLVNHTATMSHGSVTEKERLNSGITNSFFRLSIGIEAIDDILNDLKRAID